MTTTAAPPSVLAGPPAIAPVHATLCAAFQATAAAQPARTALRTPSDGERLSWAAYAERVRVTAARLATVGVSRGDSVVLLLGTRPEAAWVDAAAMHLGAVGVSLYVAATPATHAYVLDDVDARVLVTERALAGCVPALRRGCPKLEHVLGIDGEAPGVRDLETVTCAPGFDFEAAWSATRPEDPVTIMYTSGTTGAPKGTVYTHGAVVAAFAALDATLPALDEYQTVAFIPFAHAGQRAMGHYRAMLQPSTTTFCADPATLGAVVQEARPTMLFGPPAVWERVAAGARAAAEADADPARRTATLGALERAEERVRAMRAGGTAAAPTRGDDALIAGLRARTGVDRLGQPIVSAAPPAAELLESLHALGLPIMEIYAMTELPPITATRPDPADIGSVGRPVPGVQVRLAADGEVLVRHGAASAGYHRRPAQTAALFDADGWAHTGDLGTIDAAGRLRLAGRRDDRMITSFGHNVDPARLEAALKAESPLIAQACVIGDRRPHLVALITLADPAAAPAAVAAAVERANAHLPDAARIRRFLVLDDAWTPGSDELTATLKLRRAAVHARYAEQIDALYRD